MEHVGTFHRAHFNFDDTCITEQRCFSLQFAVALVAFLVSLGSVASQNDVDILNFALNLECLEAAFYTCAAFGVPLTPAYLGDAPSLPAELHLQQVVKSVNNQLRPVSLTARGWWPNHRLPASRPEGSCTGICTGDCTRRAGPCPLPAHKPGQRVCALPSHGHWPCFCHSRRCSLQCGRPESAVLALL